MIGVNTYEYWTYQNVWLVWILAEHQLIQVYILRLAQRWRKIHLRWAQRWRKVRHGYKLCIVLIIDSDQELKIVLKILCLKILILCWQNSINFTKSPKRQRELRTIGGGFRAMFFKTNKSLWYKVDQPQVQCYENHIGKLWCFFNACRITYWNWFKTREMCGTQSVGKQMERCMYSNLYVYLDILSLLWRLSLGFQPELHDPVKTLHRIQEFTWAMVKLQILVESTFDSPDSNLMYYSFWRVLWKLKVKRHIYQSNLTKEF